jgi:hypothetical protein
MQKISVTVPKTRRYTFQPLKTRANGRPTFRFLDLLHSQYDTDPLRCRIVHASLGEIQYCALSYTWGEPIFDRTLTILEGRDDKNSDEFEIPITANLDVALKRLRIDFAEKYFYGQTPFASIKRVSQNELHKSN